MSTKKHTVVIELSTVSKDDAETSTSSAAKTIAAAISTDPDEITVIVDDQVSVNEHSTVSNQLEYETEAAIKMDAVTLCEAESFLNILAKTLLAVSPKYSIEKLKGGRGQPYKYYHCTMTIKLKENLDLVSERHNLEGVYYGDGLSQRMAKMVACKNAIQAWEQQNGISYKKFLLNVKKIAQQGNEEKWWDFFIELFDMCFC